MSNKVSAITGVFDDTTGALKSISRDCGGASTGTPTPIAALSTAQQAAIDAGGSAVVVNASGVLVDKNLAPVSGGGKRPSIRTALRCFGGYLLSDPNNAYANRSYRLIINHPAAANAKAMRLMFFNNSTKLPLVITKAKVSASSTLNANGPTSGTWFDVYQNNATRMVFPPAKVADEPQPFFSNWIPCTPVARSDGGADPLFYLDCYIADNVAAFTASISGTVMTVSAVASGYIQGGQALNGGAVTAGTMVLEQLTGTAGGVGTYIVSITQTASSGSVSASGAMSTTRLNNGTNPGNKLTSESIGNSYRGRIIADYSGSGDIVGTSSGWTTGSGWGGMVFGVEFASDVDVLTVHTIGDSIGLGDGAAVPMNSGTTRACADLTISTGRPVISANHGFSSQRTGGFVNRLKILLDSEVIRGCVVIHPYSPNDEIGIGLLTQPVFDGMKANAIRMHEMCREYGVPHIFRSSTPWSGLSIAQDALRTTYDVWIESYCAAERIPFANVASALSQGTSPKSYVAGASDDGLHPNDAGYDLESPVMQAAIRAAVPAYFA